MASPWVLVSLLTERQEFQRAQAAVAREAAARAGYGVEVVYAENDPAIQIRQLEEHIARPGAGRPQAIVIETAGSFGFERVARSAVAAGIGWVLLGGNSPYVQALHAEFPAQLVTAVVTGGEAVGRMQAAVVRALLPRGGAIVCVEGPSLVAASLHRRRGLEEGLAGAAVQIVKTVTGDWMIAGAERGVGAWLELAGKAAIRPALIVAQNDEMAIGARRGIQAARPEWGALPAIGVDGLADGGLRWVREGALVATVVVAPPTGPAIDLVVAAAAGRLADPLVNLPARCHPPAEQLKPLRP
jgi:ribose transport system substrate-binding protein